MPTNPKYPQLLLTIIDKYNLHQYDTPEGEISKIKREDRVFTQIDQNIGKAVKDSIIQTTPANKYIPCSRAIHYLTSPTVLIDR